MTKIEALEKTIYNLENNLVEYRWMSFDSCNCGVLAHSIIGIDKDMRSCGLRDSPTAKGNGASAEYFCMTTGLSIPLIFQSVKDAGFTYEEMVHLETMKNQSILEKAGLSLYTRDFENKQQLIAYLKAWVEILKEEKLNSDTAVQECDARKVKSELQKPETKTIIKYVSVPETIGKSLPETILS